MKKIILFGLILVFVCGLGFAENLEDDIDKETLEILKLWTAPFTGAKSEYELTELNQRLLDAATQSGFPAGMTDVLLARHLYVKLDVKMPFVDFWVAYLTEGISALKDGTFVFEYLSEIDEPGIDRIKPSRNVSALGEMRLRAYLIDYRKHLQQQLISHKRSVESLQKQIEFLNQEE